MRIQDLMSRSVVHVSPTTSVAVAREMLLSGEIGHLVVMDGKHLAGVLSERDLSGQAGERPVSEVMSRQVVTIDPEATLRRAAGVMRGRAVDPDVTRLLDRLERAELVQRARSTTDRRVVLTTITPAGLALLEKLDEPLKNLLRQQCKGLSRERLTKLIAELEEMRAR